MPMQETMDLTQVIDHLDAHAPFSMTYVTADKKRGTGGEIKKVDGWVKCNLGDMPEQILRKNRIHFSEVRDPKHGVHKTRNIMNPVTRDIRKVHLRLIVEFNGKRVV
jgi:hypothetical protein